MQEIHGHDVMHMMLRNGKPYTRATLLADIVATFGPEARFYTCSAQGLTPEGIIDFLHARGKFVLTGDEFQTTPDRMCHH